MIKKVKGLVAVIAVLASVLVFAGCGNSTGSDGLPGNMGKEYNGEAVTVRSYEPQSINLSFFHDKNELAMSSDTIYDTSDSKNLNYTVIEESDLGKTEKSNEAKYNKKYQDKLKDKELFYLRVKGLYSVETSYWELGVAKDGKKIEMIPLSEECYEADIHADLAD